MSGVGTAVVVSVAAVLWLGWYMGWRLRSRRGLRVTDRIRRAANAVTCAVFVIGMVLTGSSVWEPGVAAALAVVLLWLVVRFGIFLVDRAQERSAQRRDLLTGHPATPRPISWDGVPMTVFLLWLAIAYTAMLAATLIAFAANAITPHFVITLSVVIVSASLPVATVIAVARKLLRDRDRRDYDALCAGIESRIRAERDEARGH